MKKLLLVLLVVALSSFLLVGCLGEGTVVDDDDDDDGIPTPVEPTVTMTILKLYPDPLITGKNYVPGTDKVTVTFSEALEVSDQVQVAVKWWNEGTEVYEYLDGAWATSTDSKVWTVSAYEFNGLAASIEALYLSEGYAADCEPICLVALVKNPCCPGEEVAEKVVFIDDVPPVVTPTITVLDCNPCPPVVDECNPVLGGAYFTYTTLVTGGTDCDPEIAPYCNDDCSGVGAWSFVVDKAIVCDACPADSGTGCTVVGAADCGCLPYFDTDVDTDESDGDLQKSYTITFDVEDNVGNEQDTITWTITVDTDEVIGTPLLVT